PAAHARLFGYVFELATAQVAVQDVPAVSGYVKIEPAVVVEIRHSHTHAPTSPSESCLLGYILEGSVRFLVIQRDHWIATLPVAFHSRAVDGYDVELAVVVTIKKLNPAAHRFDDVTLVRRGDIRHRQTTALADIFEHGPCVRVWRRGAWGGAALRPKRECIKTGRGNQARSCQFPMHSEFNLFS